MRSIILMKLKKLKKELPRRASPRAEDRASAPTVKSTITEKNTCIVLISALVAGKERRKPADLGSQ